MECTKSREELEEKPGVFTIYLERVGYLFYSCCTMKVTKHILISGRVQGVGFRYFTKKNAVSKEIKGWVRNLKDGRVEAVFHGNRENVHEMIERISEGPLHSKVTNVEIEDLDGVEFENFEVQY